MLCYSDKEGTNIKVFIDKESCGNKEKVISDRLATEYNGLREFYMVSSNHRIDVLTDEYIIEVKSHAKRYSAIGQIQHYQNDFPKKKLWIHLFDHNGCRDSMFINMCNVCNIKLTYE